MGKTKIEWATDSFNPGIFGCSKDSTGCKFCYAMAMAARLERMGQAHYAGLTTPQGQWTGEVRLLPVDEAVERVLRYPKARTGRKMVFTTSMADVLHEDIPLEWAGQVVMAMTRRPEIIWQYLTKRAERLPELWAWLRAQGFARWPENVWVMVSVENQEQADRRIPYALQVPAKVIGLSCEPLLGPVDLSEWIELVDHCDSCGAENPPQGPDKCPECGAEGSLITTAGHAQAERYRTGERYNENSPEGRADIDGTFSGISWVITGLESGREARPGHPDWARSLRDQAVAAGVAFLHKQNGEWAPVGDGFSFAAGMRDCPEDGNDGKAVVLERTGTLHRPPTTRTKAIEWWRTLPEWLDADANPEAMVKIGKKAAGRLLDGRTWDEVPNVD